MAPRWRKAISDITARPGRSALAVLAMAIGIGALSTLAFTQAILDPVITMMYGGTQPASATLYVEPLDDVVVAIARSVTGVGDAEARPVIMARVKVGETRTEEWMPAVLYVVRDFDSQRINLVNPNMGAWPPNDGDILLERSAVSVADAAPGDTLQFRLPGEVERTLRFAGTVHAAGLAPAWMEHMVYGFVAWNSPVRTHRESSQLLVRVAQHDTELGHITEVAERVQSEIESRGYNVRRVDIPTPGRHPHADQMSTFMFLVGTFGVLAFVLSAVLVAGMIHTLQSEQVKQVGVMKALGATRAQIAGVYLAHVGLLAAAAMCVGLPLGWIAGSTYAGFSAGILNADVSDSPFPLRTLVALIVVGMIVPLLAALVPVWSASRITVREALDHTPGANRFGSGRVERALARIQRLPRPLVLVLRATFVQRGRLVLTVGMLAVAGGMFMAALNLSKAWDNAASDAFERRRYDLMVQFTAPQAVAELDRALTTLPSVAHSEYWPAVSPYLIGESGVAGKRIALLGVDPASPVLVPKLTAGRWLSDASPRGVVLNHAVSALQPALGVGDTLALRLDGRTLSFPIVGLVKELLPQAIVYAPRGAVLDVSGHGGETTRSARIVLHERGEEAELAAARDVERLFESQGIEIAGLHRMAHQKGALLDHLVIIQVILTVAAALVVLVAIIGLTSTLTINVLQRTREIGVMRALGITSRVLAIQVWCEALIITALSWLVALVLAAPISYALQVVTGRMFVKASLEFTMSANATVVWLLLVVVLATLASLQPARRAARLAVREAMAYV